MPAVQNHVGVGVSPTPQPPPPPSVASHSNETSLPLNCSFSHKVVLRRFARPLHNSSGRSVSVQHATFDPYPQDDFSFSLLRAAASAPCCSTHFLPHTTLAARQETDRQTAASASTAQLSGLTSAQISARSSSYVLSRWPFSYSFRLNERVGTEAPHL
ncbi:hypothetical protein GN956_G16083 [Arapaima gigas]